MEFLGKKISREYYHSFAPCPPFGNLALPSNKIDVSSVNKLRTGRLVNLDDRSQRVGIDGHIVHLQLGFLLRGKFDFVRDHSDPLELYFNDITVFEPHLGLAAHANTRWSITALERVVPTHRCPHDLATKDRSDEERGALLTFP